MIGPYDLSGSMGILGKLEDKNLKNVINKILSIGKKMNKLPGIHVVDSNVKKIMKLKKNGFKFIGVGLDSVFLKTFSENTMKQIKKN